MQEQVTKILDEMSKLHSILWENQNCKGNWPTLERSFDTIQKSLWQFEMLVAGYEAMQAKAEKEEVV